MIKEYLEKKTEKLIDRTLYGSKKDRRIKELWDALNHAHSCMETYGAWIHRYEANPEWRPPEYLHHGDYTMEDRLKDIRYMSRQLEECSKEIYNVMFKDSNVIPPK